MIVFVGTAGSSNNQLRTPCDCAFDSHSDTLYIADTMNHRIVQYPKNASLGTVVAGDNGGGHGITQLNAPKGIYFDSLSNGLYIANTNSHNVVRWLLNASSWTLVAGNINGLSGSTSTELSNPLSVVLDSAGNIYVADRDNHRIQLYLRDNTNGTTVVGVAGVSGNDSVLLNSPSSVVVDTQFNIYVADSSNFRVQKFSLY